jgi:CTP synthase (UTP-ammonia lyase)
MLIPDAEHEETAPDASRLLISKLTCSLHGETQSVDVRPNTLAYQAYGVAQAREQFSCKYGLNPSFQDEIETGGLTIAGTGQEGEVRIVELAPLAFFVATLFLPQLSSASDHPHPLIKSFVQAAQAFHIQRRSEIGQ